MPEPDLVIYTDGGSRGNPGPAGIGCVLIKSNNEKITIKKALGVTTNNVAEYSALIAALEKAQELGCHHIELRTDSELVVRQMNGQYKVKNQGLIPLYKKARELASHFTTFVINHVRREFNAEADKLANEAMDNI